MADALGFHTLLVSCLSSSLLIVISGGAEALKIGAIVSKSHAGMEQKFAIEAAAQLLNSSSSSMIFLTVRCFTSGDHLEAASNAEELINAWGANAIIAGGTWPEVAPIVGVGRRAAAPVLISAATPPLRIAPSPFLIRMSTHPPSIVVRCIAELIRSYNWRMVIVIYEDNGYGTVSGGMVPHLHDALRGIGVDVDHFVAFTAGAESRAAAVRREMKRLSRRLCKVFVVVRASTTLALHLFKEASARGMTARGHVWITDDETTSHLHSALLTSSIASYCTQGVVGIKPYFNESTESFERFRERIKQRFPPKHYLEGCCYDPDVLAIHAYDAVHAIALASISAQKNLSSATLLQGILLSNFEGLSGNVRFKRREGVVVRGRSSSIAFRVINFVSKKSCKELGLWVERRGFYTSGDGGHRVDTLGPVYWPGGLRRVPVGWGKLRIGVPARTPFDQFVRVEYDDKGEVEHVTGYCIDVFNQTLKRLKYELQYEFIPFQGSYDQLVDQVYFKKFDAVVGDVTILAKRSEKVDFTEPYMDSGLAMLVRAKPDHRALVFIKPYTNGIWALIVVTFVYTAIIIWYLEFKNDPEYGGSLTGEIGATLWLMASTIFFAHRRIHSCYTRAVILFWLFAVLIVTQSYTAILTSILITEKLRPMVSDQRIGCDGDSFIVKYLQDVLHYPVQKILKISRPENYTTAFEAGDITAAYMETPYLRVFLSKHKGYAVHGDTHRLGGLGFVFPRGSPLAIDFSDAILQLSEQGVLKNLENKWFSFSLSNCLSGEKGETRDSIGLDHMWALFLFTGCATTIVFLLFIARSQRLRLIRIGSYIMEKLNRVLRLIRRDKEEQQIEIGAQVSTPTSLTGNVISVESVTMPSVPGESSEASSVAAGHHDIEEEVLVNQKIE